MSLFNLVKVMLGTEKDIELKSLPSQGLFYNDDFSIKIRKASDEDIIEYEHNFIKDNLSLIIYKIKLIVSKNVILPNKYIFEDIKSIDIIFIFLEIVKFTNKKPIYLSIIDEGIGYEKLIEFSKETFNYYKISNSIMSNYNKEEKCFDILGYKYTLPSIGVESSMSNYLLSIDKNDIEQYQTYFYDFVYFLNNKNNISFSEIENLIEIFNYDIDKQELEKAKNVIKIFSPLTVYSLKDNNKVIDINSKIDLEKIWK